MILPAFSALLAESKPKTGSTFVPGLQSKAGFAPLSMPIVSDDAPVDTGRYLWVQANGKHDPAETSPPPYGGFIPSKDFITARSNDDFHALYEKVITPSDIGVVSANDRYESLARTAVPSFLVCATTLKDDGTATDPFLMVVSFPTTLRKGFTRSSIWSGAKPATLEPGNVQGHKTTAFVVMASLAQNTRDENVMRANERTPEGYLSHDTVVCFSEDGALFSSVVASSQTAPGTRNTSFSDKFQLLRATTWHTVDEMRMATNKEDTWAPDVPTTGNSTCVRLAKFLPLACPSVLPPGIIGDPSLGAEGVRTFCKHYLEAEDDAVAWLDEPITQEWFAAVAADPQVFAVPWFSRSWLTESVKEINPSPRFKSDVEMNLWLTAERTLAYRLHQDFLFHKWGNGSVGKNLQRYTARAAGGLCSANTATGELPPELIGELWFVRRPKTKAWDAPASMNLSAWTGPASVAPSSREFLCHTVPPGINDSWFQPLLETNEEAEERNQVARGDDYTDSALATARQQAAALPAIATVTAASQATQGTAATIDLTNSAAKRPPPVGAVPHHSAGQPTDGRPKDDYDYTEDDDPLYAAGQTFSRRQRTANADDGSQRFIGYHHSSDADDSKPRADLPQRPVVGFDDAHPVEHRSFRRDFSIPPPPPDTRRRREDYGYAGLDQHPSPFRAHGRSQLPRTPTRSTTHYFREHEPQHGFVYNRHGQRFDPPNAARAIFEGHGNYYDDGRATDAPRHVAAQNFRVNQDPAREYAGASNVELYVAAAAAAVTKTSLPETWNLLRPVKGQPDSYAFLCMVLFQRDPHFNGVYTNAHGGIGLSVPEQDRNFPAHLSLSFRKEFLAEKEKTQALSWLANQAHAASAYSSGGVRREQMFHSVTPQLSFDLLPAETLEAFRSGNWRCSFMAHKCAPSKKYFSAFSMLCLLPETNGQPLIPAEGISFKQGIKVVECLLWLLTLCSHFGKDSESPQMTIETTPILRALYRYIQRLRKGEESAYLSVAATWDIEPPFSQQAVAFSVLRDIDDLLDLFIRLVRPPGGRPPLAIVRENRHGASDEVAISATFSSQASPLDPDENPDDNTIFASVAAWEKEKQYFVSQSLPRLQPTQLLAAPNFFVQGGKAALAAATCPSRGAEPEKHVTRNTSGRQQGKKKDNDMTSSNDNENKKQLKASKPLLRWGDDATKEIRDGGPMLCIKEAGAKPRYPATNESGNHVADAKLVCIQYTMHGVRECAKGKTCRFAHLDGEGTSKDVAAFSSLRIFLEHKEIKGKIVFTSEGKRVAGVE